MPPLLSTHFLLSHANTNKQSSAYATHSNIYHPSLMERGRGGGTFVCPWRQGGLWCSRWSVRAPGDKWNNLQDEYWCWVWCYTLGQILWTASFLYRAVVNIIKDYRSVLVVSAQRQLQERWEGIGLIYLVLLKQIRKHNAKCSCNASLLENIYTVWGRLLQSWRAPALTGCCLNEQKAATLDPVRLCDHHCSQQTQYSVQNPCILWTDP